jgi:hypothetical protein
MSVIDGNTPVVEVEVNDDLDAFSDEFFGSAKSEDTDEEDVAEVVTNVEDTDAEEVEEVAETEEDEESDEEEAAEDEEDTPEPKPAKNRKTAKERIKELASERREEREQRLIAEARAADLEARLAKLEKNDEPKPESKPAPKTAYEGPDPDAVDADGELVYPLGKFDPQFNADLVRYTLKVEREAEAKQREEQAAIREEEEVRNALVSDWNGKLDTTSETLPDLREKIAELEETFVDLEPSYGMFLAETIMKLDRGPEVLYYLANNLSEAEAIVAKSPVAATIALGRIEGQLASVPKADSNKTKVPSAKTPPPTTRGNGATKQVNADTDDLEAFEREFYGKRKTI